jgi:hypothetical protein
MIKKGLNWLNQKFEIRTSPFIKGDCEGFWCVKPPWIPPFKKGEITFSEVS